MLGCIKLKRNRGIQNDFKSDTTINNQRSKRHIKS